MKLAPRLWTLCLLLALLFVPANAQNTENPKPPQNALVTAVRGAEIMLGIGTNDGAVRGAVYGIARAGRVRARLQVTQVGAAESSAAILSADEDFIVAVGDAAQFQIVQELPANPTTSAPPIAPQPTPQSEPAQPQPLAPQVQPQPAQPQTTQPQPIPAATTAANTTLGGAAITNVVEGKVTINAGTNQGARAGAKVPIVRDGDTIAIVRLQVVAENSSEGEIIWRDETTGLVEVGDAAAIYSSSAAPATGVTTPTTNTVVNTNTPDAEPIPATPIRWETGASNAVVPRADVTYSYLAALAVSKLITRYPAHLFHDDGVRRHRAEEDINFSRSQIALLVQSAITAADERGVENLGGKERAALRALVQEYERELKKLGVEESTLNALGTPGFTFGVSGQSRASIVGGSARNGGNEPFSERQGGRRTRSGFDTRTNIFGQISDSTRFFAQLDAGSETRRGARDSGFDLNRAFVEWNAERVLRGLSLKVGRDELWWGPGHFGTLLLGDTAGPFNLIQSTFKRGSYKFESLYAPLDRGPLGGQRSLYGHNLSVQVGPQTRIGAAETLLLPSDRFDPLSFVGAFSPLPLFAIERARNRNTAADNGNVLVQAYIEQSIARGVRGWGEFLIDDIGVNQNNLVRNRLGSLVGLHVFTPRDPAKLGLVAEYANLQGRTYLGLRALNDADYFYRGNPIGYPVAPPQGAALGGAESVRFEAYWRATPRLRLSTGVELADLASEQANRARQQVYRFRAAYDLSRTLTLVARAQRVATSQRDFILGQPSLSQNLLQFEIVQSF